MIEDMKTISWILYIIIILYSHHCVPAKPCMEECLGGMLNDFVALEDLEN